LPGQVSQAGSLPLGHREPWLQRVSQRLACRSCL